MQQVSITVRRLSSQERQTEDWKAIYDLCCRTGDNGQPIARERWGFFGRLWVSPYEKILPDWTYVAEAEGVIVGYLTGCPDSRGFARSKSRHFVLPFLVDIFRGRYQGSRDAHRFVRQIFGIEKRPEGAFSPEFHRMIQRSYPAHLHINVESTWRGLGVGRRMVERFVADLRGAGVAGAHLYCGSDPLRFYLRLGFKELGRKEFHGAPVYVLGYTISKSP